MLNAVLLVPKIYLIAPFDIANLNDCDIAILIFCMIFVMYSVTSVHVHPNMCTISRRDWLLCVVWLYQSKERSKGATTTTFG